MLGPRRRQGRSDERAGDQQTEGAASEQSSGEKEGPGSISTLKMRSSAPPTHASQTFQTVEGPSSNVSTASGVTLEDSRAHALTMAVRTLAPPRPTSPRNPNRRKQFCLERSARDA